MGDPKFKLRDIVEVFSRADNHRLGIGRVKMIEPLLLDGDKFLYRVKGRTGYIEEHRMKLVYREPEQLFNHDY